MSRARMLLLRLRIWSLLRLRVWARNEWRDLTNWPGKPYGVTWWEGYASPRSTVLVWLVQRRCLSCGLRKPTHKMQCSDRHR